MSIMGRLLLCSSSAASELLSLRRFRVPVGSEYLPGGVQLMRRWKKLAGWRSVVVGTDCFDDIGR